jgi:DnaJ-class molecular chaperone
VVRTTYYATLGIGQGASAEGIRAAYLRLVKALHPDHAGQAGTSRFREVQQAYDVLSDPARKKEYDDQLTRSCEVRRTRRPFADATRDVEPLIPDEPLIGRGPNATGPVFGQSLNPFTNDTSAIGIGPRCSASEPQADLVISPREARFGTRLTIAIPVRHACSDCAGTGIDWPFPCFACAQTGRVLQDRLMRLTIPPHTRSGTIVHIQTGSRPEGALRIRLLVDSRMRAPPFG